jgi:hypothetical protein
MMTHFMLRHATTTFTLIIHLTTQNKSTQQRQTTLACPSKRKRTMMPINYSANTTRRTKLETLMLSSGDRKRIATFFACPHFRYLFPHSEYNSNLD